MKFNYFTTKIPFLGLLSILFLMTSCGSYEYVGYDNDGIYGQDERITVEYEPQQQTTPERTTDGNYYKNYFSEKANELDYALNNDEIFTDIDSYEGDYNEDLDSLNYNNSYAGWGQTNSNVTINVIDRGWGSWGWYDPWLWNSPWMYNSWTYYRPWRWGPSYAWGWNNWGWNAGFGWGWNNWGYGYPYYGYGYYGNPYYNNYYGNYYRRGIAYNAGRRGSYLNRNYSTLDRRSATSRLNRNSTVRSRSNSRTYNNNNRSTRPRSTTRTNTPRRARPNVSSPRRSSSRSSGSINRSSSSRRSSGSVSRSSRSSRSSSGSRSSSSSRSSSRSRK